MTRMRFTAEPVRGQNCIRLMMTAGQYFEIDLSRDEAIDLLGAVNQAVSDLCITPCSSFKKAADGEGWVRKQEDKHGNL